MPKFMLSRWIRLTSSSSKITMSVVVRLETDDCRTGDSDASLFEIKSSSRVCSGGNLLLNDDCFGWLLSFCFLLFWKPLYPFLTIISAILSSLTPWRPFPSCSLVWQPWSSPQTLIRFVIRFTFAKCFTSESAKIPERLLSCQGCFCQL